MAHLRRASGARKTSGPGSQYKGHHRQQQAASGTAKYFHTSHQVDMGIDVKSIELTGQTHAENCAPMFSVLSLKNRRRVHRRLPRLSADWAPGRIFQTLARHVDSRDVRQVGGSQADVFFSLEALYPPFRGPYGRSFLHQGRCQWRPFSASFLTVIRGSTLRILRGGLLSSSCWQETDIGTGELRGGCVVARPGLSDLNEPIGEDLSPRACRTLNTSG
ncbi:hypothetical protein LY76DRAFT_58061 [Colletotrichum caudatum]|nr:hypothetical protein LY76DRAFT_58061 [Colletotrichum caudatum]